MKFKFTEGEKNTINMEIEIPFEEMELPIKKTIKEYSQRVSIPGFRKGKVPAQVVESFVGVKTIMLDAAQDMIAEKYSAEIEKQEFVPIAPPRLEAETLEKNQPVIMKGVIPIQPPVKLGKYKGLKVTKRKYAVGDIDVEQEIQNNLTRIGKLVDAPKGTKTEFGQVVNIDFRGEVDGKSFEGGSAEDYPIQLGAGNFVPGFEEQLVGLKVGEEKDVNLTFPHGYAETNLAGKDAIFHCRIVSIHVKELPELNDDLVKDLSETADTVEQWKLELKEKLQAEADESAEEEFKNAVIGEALKDVEVEIPMLMTEPRVNQMYEDLSQKLEEQELDIQDYLKYMNTDLFSLRKKFREQAESDLKVELMLQTIAKKEKLEILPEDIDKEVAELADYYMQDVESYKKLLVANDQMRFIYDKVLADKAANFLFENAKVTEEVFDAESVKKMLDEQAAAEEAAKAEKPAKKTTRKKAAAEEPAAEEAPKKKTTKKAAEVKEEAAEAPKKKTTKKAAEVKEEAAEAPKKAAKKPAKKAEETAEAAPKKTAKKTAEKTEE